MTRIKLMKPSSLYEKERISELEKMGHFDGMPLLVDSFLLFKGEHHFEAMDGSYPNGRKKLGTLRYRSGYVRVPFGKKLFVYETDEFNARQPPRGMISIDSAIAGPLKELSEEELLNDGFFDREDLLYQMTEMEGRYYQDLTPDSIVTFYAFSGINPNPSEEELEEVLSALDQFGETRHLVD
jgi:hypothetical protein